jgi:type VI secretion system protein ImpH
MEALAADGRRAAHPVARRLLDPDQAPRFDFLQAVRLLELVHRRRADDARAAGDVPPDRTIAGSEISGAVRFRSRVSLGFPAADLAGVEAPGHPGGPFTVTVDFMGLAGITGPLPHPLTWLVIERSAKGDDGPRDFLDIFNHRLVELMYAARKKHRPALATTPPEEAPLAETLFALAGLGTGGMRTRLEARGVPDRALLTYAGLLAQRPRSMHGLETMLEDYFGVRVRGRQFRGRWLALEPEDRTRIGAAGAHRTLGRSAVLGSRFWDQQAAFELELGPLGRREMMRFLPTGSAWMPLCQLVRFWVGVDLEFTVRLVLRRDEVPRMRLNGRRRLGWTSWLSTTTPHADDAQVVLDEGAVAPDQPPSLACVPGDG